MAQLEDIVEVLKDLKKLAEKQDEKKSSKQDQLEHVETLALTAYLFPAIQPFLKFIEQFKTAGELLQSYKLPVGLFKGFFESIGIGGQARTATLPSPAAAASSGGSGGSSGGGGGGSSSGGSSGGIDFSVLSSFSGEPAQRPAGRTSKNTSGNLTLANTAAEAGPEAAVVEQAAENPVQTGLAGLAAQATLLSGGLAAIPLAIAGVVTAFSGLVVSVQDLGKSFLESQRYLAEVSGSMAQVFAQSEVFNIMRNQKIGEAVAPSAAQLEKSLEGLMTTLTPYVAGIYAAVDVGLSWIVNWTKMLLEWLEKVMLAPIIERLDSFFGLGGKLMERVNAAVEELRKKEINNASTQWLSNLSDEYDRRKKAGTL